MYMMENTNRVQQGASEASPPACTYIYIHTYIQTLSDNAVELDTLHYGAQQLCMYFNFSWLLGPPQSDLHVLGLPYSRVYKARQNWCFSRLGAKDCNACTDSSTLCGKLVVCSDIAAFSDLHEGR